MTTATLDTKQRIKAANLVARRHFGELQWPTLALSAILVTVFAVTMSATLTGAVPLVVGAVVLVAIQFPTYICFHEAAHGNISRGPLNDALGTVLGSALGAPLVAHRREHLAHHAYTNRPGADPDIDSFADGRFGIRGGWDLFIGQYRFFAREGWPDAGVGERARFLAETAAGAAWRIGLVVAFGWQAALLIAIMPALGLLILSYLLVYRVHAIPRPLPEGRWIDTISYETDHLPRFLQRLVDWGWMGHQVHGVHHLYPSVPFYRQQGVFEEIKPLMIDLDAPVRRLWPDLARGAEA